MKNLEKRREYDRAWKRQWREKNPGLSAKLQKIWKEKNPERVLFLKRKYRKDNREKVNEQYRLMYKRRYQQDSNFKLAKNLRNRVNKIFLGVNKSTCTLELLGVQSVKEVLEHIETQFKVGMSWKNYRFDVWHIDHIRPLSSFDLTKKEEQLKAFNYTNLQPLWALDNLRKGKKIKN